MRVRSLFYTYLKPLDAHSPNFSTKDTPLFLTPATRANRCGHGRHTHTAQERAGSSWPGSFSGRDAVSARCFLRWSCSSGARKAPARASLPSVATSFCQRARQEEEHRINDSRECGLRHHQVNQDQGWCRHDIYGIGSKKGFSHLHPSAPPLLGRSRQRKVGLIVVDPNHADAPAVGRLAAEKKSMSDGADPVGGIGEGFAVGDHDRLAHGGERAAGADCARCAGRLCQGGRDTWRPPCNSNNREECLLSTPTRHVTIRRRPSAPTAHQTHRARDSHDIKVLET